MTIQRRFAVTFCCLLVPALPLLAAEKPKEAAPAPAAVGQPAPSTPSANEVVARVNGDVITRKELDAATQGMQAQMAMRGHPVPREQLAQLQYDVLDELIGRQLVVQEARKTPMEGLDDKVQAQLASVKAQMGGEEGFSKALSESSVTIQEYTARVRENIMVRENVQRFVDANVKVSPEEVKRYYDENKAQFKEPEQVRASHILITVAPTATDEEKKQKRAQIDAALALVKSGTPFAEVAKKFSEDTISARNGGDLGYFNRGQMVAEFENAAFGLKTNQVSDVITSKFGYHVLLVTDHKMPREVGLDEVKDDIEKYLKYRKGSDVTRQHVKQLREVAKVEVLLPAPPPVESAPQSLAPASKASAPVVATPPVAAPTQQNKK